MAEIGKMFVSMEKGTAIHQFIKHIHCVFDELDAASGFGYEEK